MADSNTTEDSIKKMIEKFPKGTKMTFDNRDATVESVDKTGVFIVFDSSVDGKKGKGEGKFVHHDSAEDLQKMYEAIEEYKKIENNRLKFTVGKNVIYQDNHADISKPRIGVVEHDETNKEDNTIKVKFNDGESKIFYLRTLTEDERNSGSGDIDYLKVKGWMRNYGGNKTKRHMKKSRRKTNRKKRKTNRRRTSKK